jgi:hypothetical protein
MKHQMSSHLLVALLVLGESQAQTIWTQRTAGSRLTIEYMQPTFANTISWLTTSGSIVTLNGKVQVGSSVGVIVEVPYVSGTISTSFPFASSAGSVSEKKGGNVYVGLEIGNFESNIFLEIGARPFATETSSSSGIIPMVGAIGDFDRQEAYLEKMSSYQAALNLTSTQTQGFVYRVRVGPTIFVPKTTGSESITLMDYGLKMGYDNGQLGLLGGISGRWNTKIKSGKAAYHHLALDLGYRFGKIRPAFFYRMPLDKEMTDIVARTIGANITVAL